VAGAPYRLDRAALAAVVALAVQIGANYANDYSDGIRGTDANRTGPARLVASGLASPAAVLRAALIAFGIAAAAGIALAVPVNPWLIALGLAAIAAAWFYTGGPKPYGYAGLGEVSVFVFFGLLGTLGSAYVQHAELTPIALWASVAVGSLTSALLVANNLRDIPGDAANGKRTLAVKLGDRATRHLYLALLGAAACATLGVVVARPWAALAFVAIVVAIRPVRTVCAGATGKALVPVLVDTGRLELTFAVLLAISLLV
jgi:1,4-dihydroxy-2-naphthoate octaprenyltransferase